MEYWQPIMTRDVGVDGILMLILEIKSVLFSLMRRFNLT